MEKIDLLEDVAPSSNEIGAVADMAQRMLEIENEINRLDELLKQKKQDLKMLAEQDLPDLMQELNIRDFTLSNGAKVSVKDVITASVGVHPQTLNSFIKERMSEGKEVPMEMFRVYAGRRANIRR